jgi:hypothetical protein
MKCLSALLCVLTAGSAASAQAIKMDPVRARPLVSLGSITLQASPATINFNLVSGGVAAASSPLTVTTSGLSLGLLSTVKLYAYFGSTNALISSNGDTIPVSAISAKCPTGLLNAFTAFTQTTPLSGASGLQIIQDTNLLDLLGSGRTDMVSLQIDLTSQPQQPAGNYGGTLVLQAQAF